MWYDVIALFVNLLSITCESFIDASASHVQLFECCQSRVTCQSLFQ